MRAVLYKQRAELEICSNHNKKMTNTLKKHWKSIIVLFLLSLRILSFVLYENKSPSTAENTPKCQKHSLEGSLDDAINFDTIESCKTITGKVESKSISNEGEVTVQLLPDFSSSSEVGDGHIFVIGFCVDDNTVDITAQCGYLNKTLQTGVRISVTGRYVGTKDKKNVGIYPVDTLIFVPDKNLI